MIRIRVLVMAAFVTASAATSHVARADVPPPATPCTKSNLECAACDSLVAGDCCTVHGKQGECTEESGKGGVGPIGLVCIVSGAVPSCTPAASAGGSSCSVERTTALEAAVPWMVVGLVPLLLWQRRRGSGTPRKRSS